MSENCIPRYYCSLKILAVLVFEYSYELTVVHDLNTSMSLRSIYKRKKA